MAEAAESAVEAKEAKEKDRTVALIIAILALLLALSEAGARRAQHLSTEKNIEASDLFNFYQAKKSDRRLSRPRRKRSRRRRAPSIPSRKPRSMTKSGISRRRLRASTKTQRSPKIA